MDAHPNNLCEKLVQTNGILSKLRHYVPQKICILVIFLLVLLIYFMRLLSMQKQPPEVFCKKVCSWKLHRIHRKTPLFLLKKRLRHKCFPVNFAKFLNAHFLQNTSRRLLLSMTIFFKNQSS